MPIQIVSGDEYTGETYIYCDSHIGRKSQTGVNLTLGNSIAHGVVFEVDYEKVGEETKGLLRFIAEHLNCS